MKTDWKQATAAAVTLLVRERSDRRSRCTSYARLAQEGEQSEARVGSKLLLRP
ncbi:MAG: hypothetical protein ACOYIG_08180 [Acetivibrionales bacterium]